MINKVLKYTKYVNYSEILQRVNSIHLQSHKSQV